MPVLYKPFRSKLEDKTTGKRLYYPRVVRAANVGTDKISKEIAVMSSLTAGDVKNALDNLSTVIARHLQNSETVTIDGLGTFRMVMIARGKGVETPKKVKAAQATLTARFQPSITRNEDGTTQTRALVTGAKCVRYDKLTSMNLDEDEMLEEPGGFGDNDGDDGEGEYEVDGGNASGNGDGTQGGNANGSGSQSDKGSQDKGSQDKGSQGSKDETPYPMG